MCLSGSHKWKHDLFHRRILNIPQNRVSSGLNLQFSRHSQTCLDPRVDMAHAQAETQLHLNLWVRWEKTVSVEKEVYEPYFEGRVGFMEALQQMIHEEKA